MNAPLYDNAIASRGEPAAARYREISPAAVLSVVLAALSAAVFLAGPYVGAFLLLSVIPLAAIAAGWWALRRISHAREEVMGVLAAQIGIGLAALLWIGGLVWLLTAGLREVPTGYQAVTYAQLQPNPDVPEEMVPQTALDLKDKRIYIKGYIVQPPRQWVQLKRFVLCPTNGTCQFCIPNPTATEMIRVTLDGDLRADYTTRLIGIGGRFHIDEKDPLGIPYSMDVDYLK
jgi:hypothetical protein